MQVSIVPIHRFEVKFELVRVRFPELLIRLPLAEMIF